MSSRKMKITQGIRAERRQAAEERQKEYDLLSVEEKLAKLPKDGAVKQRAKLSKLVNKNNEEAK
jgi:hypothetical protein